jgi:hypothetical protein
MFGRRNAKPDPALLAGVTDASDVELGTYPEDVLAVTGAYPARGTLDRRDDGNSGFRRLDTHARQAAMQAALDRLIADGTVALPPDTPLEKAVAAGVDGKLPVTGALGALYGLCVWLHRAGLRSGVVVNLTQSEGLKGVAMPPGTAPPGIETCFVILPDDRKTAVLLVERPDNEASTRSYTLRTPRREFTRMAGFLFSDVITPGEGLVANADMLFQFGKSPLKIENDFIRSENGEKAMGRLITHIPRKKDEEPTYIKVSPSEFIDVLTVRFERIAQRAQ